MGKCKTRQDYQDNNLSLILLDLPYYLSCFFDLNGSPNKVTPASVNAHRQIIISSVIAEIITPGGA